jgi:uncharacterized protein GlcG (DUF336 family)
MVLNDERVLKILAQARARSTELGLKTSTAVVDENGLLQGFVRMEGARFTTVEIAQGKARGSAGVRRPTVDVAERAQRPVFMYQMVHEGFIFAQGGVPIMDGEEFIGAVGVSGASDPNDDEAIAYAGLAL